MFIVLKNLVTVLNNAVNEHPLAYLILMIPVGISSAISLIREVGADIRKVSAAIRHNTTGQTIKFEEPQS
jgi:hypothetical protein